MAGAPPPDWAMMSRLMRVDCEPVIEALAITSHIEAGELHAHMRNGMRVVVELRGEKRGLFLDKSDGSGGDTLELVHRILGQPDHRVAYDWGKAFFGVGNNDAVRALAARREVVTGEQRRQVEEKLSFTDRVRRGISRYLGGTGAPSVAWPQPPELAAYLAGRGIQPQNLPGPGALKTLRFSKAQWHRESERDWPAMLAPIIDPRRRKIIAAHLTFLAGERDAWTKAPVKPAKKVTAEYQGGIIPLLRGASGKPLQFAPANEAVLIAEGIENALAAAILLAPDAETGIDPAPRVFAAVSAPNLPHVQMPEHVAEVYLIADHYEPGYANPAVERAYDRAERNWLEAGLAVTRRQPPKGYKDFADALQDLTVKS